MAAKTAKELLDALSKDPDFVARQAAAERERQALEKTLRADEKPVVDDLRDAGVAVDSVWDLVNTGRPYPAAVPVLIRHLRRPYHTRTRQGIARALTVREAQAVEADLLSAFRAETDNAENGVKWLIGNALSVAASDRILDDVIALATDPTHGPARRELLTILQGSRHGAVRAALESLVDDPDLGERARELVLKH